MADQNFISAHRSFLWRLIVSSVIVGGSTVLYVVLPIRVWAFLSYWTPELSALIPYIIAVATSYYLVCRTIPSRRIRLTLSLIVSVFAFVLLTATDFVRPLWSFMFGWPYLWNIVYNAIVIGLSYFAIAAAGMYAWRQAQPGPTRKPARKRRRTA